MREKGKTLPYSKNNDEIRKSLFGNHNANYWFRQESSLNDDKSSGWHFEEYLGYLP